MAIAIRPAGTKQLAGTELMGHLFRRAGFGATREQLEAATAQGYEATVEQLLHPENAQPLEEDLIFRYYPDMKEAGQIDPAQSRWVYRMINTRRPLEEKMALFWHHLFATGFAKLNHAKVMTNQIALFRKHALGDFRTLLIEISRDPAMIFWLDNHTNTKRVHNENYGRELLETIWRRPSSQWSNAGSTAGPRRSVDRAERLRQDDSLQSDHRSDSPHVRPCPSPSYRHQSAANSPYQSARYRTNLSGDAPVRTDDRSGKHDGRRAARRRGESRASD